MSDARFQWKQFAGIVLVGLPVLALLGELNARRIAAELRAAQDRHLHTVAIAIADRVTGWLTAVDGGDSLPDDAVLSTIARAGEVRVSVFGADGMLLADSDPRAVRGSREAIRAELKSAATAGEALVERPNLVDGSTMAFCALRLPTVGAPRGFVRVGGDRAMVTAPAGAVTTTYAIGAAAVLAGAWFVAMLQARLLRRPVDAITEMAESIERGEFPPDAPASLGDEFDGIRTALKRVAERGVERMEMMATDRNKVLAILGVMVEGVVAVDAHERIVHMNATAAQILGTQAANTEGRLVLEVCRVSEVHAILAGVLASGRADRGELRLVQPPRDRHVEMHATPLLDGDGAIVGAVLMLNDVTELRRLEAIRRDFVANVSHELKTPITAIRGLVETVLDDAAMVVETRQRFLERIREQSFRLSSLVTDLLTLSRLEADGHLGENTPLDLRGPVRDSAHALGQVAEDKGTQVHLELPDDPVTILGEAESLRLLVSNLLDNALKYTPPGGNVWARIKTAAGHAILEVADDGIGIERKHLDRIFQRFYRVDKARSRELGGTGLGLSIVKHVCHAHRGEVTVDSVPGHGTTFRVRLPLA